MPKKKIQISMADFHPKKKGQSKKWYMDKIMIGARGTKYPKHRCNMEDLFPSKPNYLIDP